MPSQHGICVFSSTGSITHIDSTAEQILCCQPGAALGRDVVEVLPFVAVTRPESLTENGSSPTEASFELPGGTWARVSFTSISTLDGGGIITLREIRDPEPTPEELCGSEQQSRLLFDQNPLPMWVYDVETLRFLDVNPAAVYQYGYSRHEFLSMTLADIRPDEDIPPLIEAVRRNATAPRAQGRWRHKRKNGTIIIVDVTSTAMTYNGRAAKLAVLHDVTEWEESYRTVRKATALIDAIVNTVPLAIWGEDLQGNVNFWNCKAEEMFGWAEEELVGSQSPLQSANGEDARGGVERTIKCKDGRIVYCNLWTAPLRDGTGKKIGTIAVAADATERRNARQELATHIRNLARSNEDLSQFAYAASHDLQEPLRNIHLFTELLSQLELQGPDERGRDYLSHILKGARHIQDLVRGLREYWDIGQRVPDLTTEIDGSAVVTELLGRMRDKLDSVGASVRCAPLPTLVGGDGELRNVFEELLNNAIKFRGQDQLCIEISAQRARVGVSVPTENEWSDSKPITWEICVCDNGIGFKGAYANQVFGIFRRLSRQTEGIGLGLALVKRMVERHGGTIWVKSEEGKGSAFYFTWPGL